MSTSNGSNTRFPYSGVASDKRKERTGSAASSSSSDRARKWGSSARDGSSRKKKWASPDHGEQWRCQQCSYQNADPRNRMCVLCGWDRQQSPSPARNGNKSILSGAWPPSPIHESPAEEGGNNNTCKLPLQLLEPPKISKATSESDNSSLNEEDDSIGTIRTSNLGAILELGDATTRTTSDPNNASPGDILLYEDSDQSTKDSFSDDMLTPPRPASHFLTLEADDGSSESTTLDSDASGNVERSLAAASRPGRKQRGQYFRGCTNQTALLAVAAVLFVFSIIFIVVAATMASDNSGGGGSSTSPEWPPIDDWSTAAPVPTSSPQEGTEPTAPEPTAPEPTAPEPTAPTSSMPTPMVPTQSPTSRPTPPESLALQQLGLELDESYGSRSFGSMVSFSEDGKTIAASAPNGHVPSLDYIRPGVVVVYKYLQEEWTQLGQLLHGKVAGDKFGQSLELSSDGGTIAVGAPENDATGENVGMVQVYKYDEEDNVWIPLGSDIFGPNAGDRTGVFLSLAGNGRVLAICTETYVVVYEYDEVSADWVGRGKIIENGNGGNQVGWTASLSEDGSVLAVGGLGSAPGFAQVYDYDEETKEWIRRGLGFLGSIEANDDTITAPSVSLSRNGDIVAVRSRLNDRDSPVQVFKTSRNNDEWEPQGESIVGDTFNEISDRYPGDPRSVSLSTDGAFVSMNGYESPLLFWFDGGTWRMLLEESDQLPSSVDIVTLSGNGQMMAVSDIEQGRVHIYEIQ